MKPMTFESTSVKKSHKPCFFYEKATFSWKNDKTLYTTACGFGAFYLNWF
jgi:hypothetical protein